jgi:16S rRNA (cytosine967-C5)-methyltransferase
MDDLLYKELGKQWNLEAEALNLQAQVIIRANTLKTTKQDLAKALKEKKIDTEPVKGCKDGLYLKERQNLFTLPEFQEGLFEVQDASSQLVAEFLQPEPGMRVIDACAGAGGKSLHIAALMQSKGRLISLDTEEWKLEETKKRARRAGVSNLETRLIEGGKTLKKLQDTADRLLLDVPCSGLGVLKRNPDAKWKLSQLFIDHIKEKQQEIITEYCKMVKVGGKMVYATCSILPSENQEQVQKFLAKNANFTLEEERIVLPSESGFDGFYMARMLRNA